MASGKSFELTAEILGKEMVTLYIGPERTEFLIHKKLLCARSEFFSKAFNSTFKEGLEGTMELPEDDAHTFASFFQFVYGDTIAVDSKSDPYAALFDLYILAERLCMNELCNLTMDKIRCMDMQANYRKPEQFELIKLAYSRTHENSKLRTYCVLLALHRSDIEDNKDGKPYVDVALEVPAFATDYILLNMQCGREIREWGRDPRASDWESSREMGTASSIYML